MFKRLFGRKPPPAPPPRWDTPTWGEPQVTFRNIFNLHLHTHDLDMALTALADRYLYAATNGPALLLQPAGDWITAYCAPDLVAKVGFNKLAYEIASSQAIWLIGYRIYAAQALDVHYFAAADHVAGLAFSQDELENEPLQAATFAPLADVQGIVPRPASQHPLDFHFALLTALGITAANLTWAEALQQYEVGAFPAARLLSAPVVTP